ncbi:MAG: sulfite exporter TauE/SafE family protein [Planctomycetota bacterium]|nr:sulfite exporter TauE/SafE family protein [Planctomycetota bacterium]
MEILTLVLIGLVAGTLGSLLGLGGGFLVVPALILLKELEPRIASGTAIAVIVPTMLVALWRRGIQGHIDFPLAGQIAIGAIAGAFLGSWLAGFLPAIVIRRTFAFVLVGLAALLFFKE